MGPSTSTLNHKGLFRYSHLFAALSLAFLGFTLDSMALSHSCCPSSNIDLTDGYKSQLNLAEKVLSSDSHFLGDPKLWQAENN